MIDAAEYYAMDLGWPVFPLRPGSKTPATPRGFLDASTDAEQIDRWFARGDYGVAARTCGRLVVLDVDVKNGKAGLASLDALVEEHGSIETWEARTPSGGRHYFFAPRPGRPVERRATEVRPGIDVLGVGGITLAPTVRPEGVYRWCGEDVGLAVAPAWLCDLAPAVQTSRPATFITGRWGHDVLDRTERCLRYVDRMDPAIAGAGGHHTLWRVALVTRGFELPEAAALEVLRHYSARCHPPWSERELAHKLRQTERSSVPSGYLLDEDRR